MATEPISSTSAAVVLVGAIGSLFGPTWSPVVLMFIGSLIGALAMLGRTKTNSNKEIALFLSISIGLSFVLTGLGVWLVERWTPLPGNIALMPVACFFAVAKDKIVDMVDPILKWFSGRMFGQKDESK